MIVVYGLAVRGTMGQARAILPVRLLPRKRSLVFRLCFFTFFFVFSVFWTLLAMVKSPHVDFFGVDLTNFEWRSLFPLWGIPFILIGGGGLVSTVLKILPGNPYFHLDFFVDRLVMRDVTKERRFAWHDLPPLTLKEESDSESGPSYYVVAMDGASVKSREMLCIPIDQYGTANSKKGALELAAWINRLRDLALHNRLDVRTEIDIPDGFARHVVALSIATRLGATVERTVVRAR
jgi:hypothetical protein